MHTLVNSFNWGGVAFDPVLPAEDTCGTVDTVGVVYTRTLSIAGWSANVGLQVPIFTYHFGPRVWLAGDANFYRGGQTTSRGAYTTIGGDFTSIAVGYNYAWARE